MGVPGFVPSPAKAKGPNRSKGIPRQPNRAHQSRLTEIPAPTLRAPEPSRSPRPTHLPVTRRDERVPGWLAGYRRWVMCVDVTVVVVCVLIGQFGRFDSSFHVVTEPVDAGYDWMISAVVIAAWLVLLAVEGAWDTEILGSGRTEYRRVAGATLMAFSMVGIAAYLTMADIFRGYLILAAPLGLGGLLLGRWWWRRGLLRDQRSGSRLRAMLVVGDQNAAITVCVALRDRPDAGYRVEGVCLPADGAGVGPRNDVDAFRVLGDWRDVADIADVATESDADTVAVTMSTGLSGVRLVELAWRLQSAGIRLAVDRRLLGSDQAPVRGLIPGLPLVSVRGPQVHGSRLFARTAVDLGVAAVGVVLLSPLMLLAAVGVVLADGGPAFSVREWEGMRGRVVRVWSFRCTPRRPKARLAAEGPTQVGADSTDAATGAAGGIEGRTYRLDLTKIGRLLRRTGIEGSPRLFSVLAGQVSVVGPKPRLPGEAGAWPTLVKPGLTGLWRVSPQARPAEQQADAAGRQGGPNQQVGAAGGQRATNRQEVAAGIPGDAAADFADANGWSVMGELRIVARTVAAIVAGTDRP